MQISVAGDSTADKQPVREPERERDGDMTKFKYPTISPAASSAQLHIAWDETKDGIWQLVGKEIRCLWTYL